MFREFIEVPGGYRNPPGAIWALVGFSGKEKGAAQGGRTPPPSLVLLGLGKVAGQPLSLSPLGESYLE